MGLMKELGAREFSERVIGAMIDYKGVPTILVELSGDGTEVRATSFQGTTEKIKSNPISIPVDYFTDLTTLKFPQLGYRSAASGQYLCYMQRMPSATKKGLHGSQLKTTLSPLSHYLFEYSDLNLDYFTKDSTRALMIFKPEMMSIAEGLRKVKEGSILSFVVDENFAVVPSTRQDSFMTILYRERIIGTLTENGNINIPLKQARAALQKAIEGRTYGEST